MKFNFFTRNKKFFIIGKYQINITTLIDIISFKKFEFGSDFAINILPKQGAYKSKSLNIFVEKVIFGIELARIKSGRFVFLSLKRDPCYKRRFSINITKESYGEK